MGDLGLFRAVVNAVQLPGRWQKRLSDAFWRPDAFRLELQRLTTSPGAAATSLPAEVISAVQPGDLLLLVIGPAQEYTCDSTQLDFIVRGDTLLMCLSYLLKFFVLYVCLFVCFGFVS